MSRRSRTHRTHRAPSRPPPLCLNCHALLRGPYCSQCGQHDIDYRRSFHHLTHDLLENLFHFEGKFFSSVAWLLATPGRLTVEFNSGRRQSQLNPLRFYLFVTVLFFLGVHLLNDGHLIPFNRAAVDEATAQVQRNVERVLAVTRDLTPAQRERVAESVAEIAGENGGNVDQEIIAEVIARVKREMPASPEAATRHDALRIGSAPARTPGREPADDTSGPFALAAEKLNQGQLTPSKVFDAIEGRVPTLLFLGMPVFALLLKISYPGTNRYYIEHLIFALHLHTWAFLV